MCCAFTREWLRYNNFGTLQLYVCCELFGILPWALLNYIFDLNGIKNMSDVYTEVKFQIFIL